MVAETGPAARDNNRLPRGRAPVPQSSTKIPPDGVVSSTHDVLPPKRVVPGPGAAMDLEYPRSALTFPFSGYLIRARSKTE